MSGSCTLDSHSRPHHSAYSPVCHRVITERSHACPIEDSGYSQPQGSIYAHPVTAPQAPTATDAAVHWWQLAGNSTDPADLALLAPRVRAEPNRLQHPPHATEFAGTRVGARCVPAGPPGWRRTPSRRSGRPGRRRRDHGPPAVPHPRSPFGIILTRPSDRCPPSAARTPAGAAVDAERAPGANAPAHVARTPAGAGRGPGRPAEHPRHLGVHDVTVPGPRTATAAAPFGVPTRVALSPHPEVR